MSTQSAHWFHFGVDPFHSPIPFDEHSVYSTVIGNGRTLQEDTTICGYHIPKGIQVVFPTIVTGSMEQYCRNAGEFKPERWMKSADDSNSDAIHPFASLPYGYGARMCLGRRFADLEIQILLAKVSWLWLCR